MYSTYLTGLAFVSVAAAQINPMMHLPIPTPKPTATTNTEIAARQNDDCTSSASALITGMPQPTDSALLSYIQDFQATADLNDDAVNYCGVTTEMPQSVSSAYSEYDSSLWEWWSSTASDGFEDMASACGVDNYDTSEVTSYVDAIKSYTSADCTGNAPVSLTFPTGGAGMAATALPGAGMAAAGLAAGAAMWL